MREKNPWKEPEIGFPNILKTLSNIFLSCSLNRSLLKSVKQSWYHLQPAKPNSYEIFIC